MTETTIKEKMTKIIREKTAEFSKPFHSDDDLAQILANTQDAILKDFARLICEEMTGKYRKFHTPEIHTPVCGGHSCACIGYDCRVAQEMDKAQEILKALE